jgi:hypothetical protein
MTDLVINTKVLVGLIKFLLENYEQIFDQKKL